MSSYNPSGSLRLIFETKESSSGHSEYRHLLNLIVENGTQLALVKEESEKNFIKNSNSYETEEKFVISIDEVVRFIRANGKRC